ncbi:MAG: cytochrome c-type biogenesis protein CcmH [Acidimicrobiia bacterium]
MSETTRSVLRGVLLVILATIIVLGVAIGDDTAPDRVASLGARIRCPVCSGESIADSPSETARAMMEVVAEQVESGRSDAEILDFFQARFGEVILLDPAPRGANLILWLLPVAALAVGIALAAGQLRVKVTNNR